MHFWHPDLPRNGAYDAEWHDHRYDFHSSVITGDITNEIAFYESDINGSHDLYSVCCAGTGSEFKERVSIHKVAEFNTQAGNSYFLEKDMLHRVRANRCVTLQTRGAGITKLKANVATESFVETSPFEQILSEDYMWEIMEDLLGKKPGYHLENIQKGELGEVSKIREEVEELIDAWNQNARVMQLVEMSDLVGAMEEFLRKHHPGYSFDDLRMMKNITARAFLNGHRS